MRGNIKKVKTKYIKNCIPYCPSASSTSCSHTFFYFRKVHLLAFIHFRLIHLKIFIFFFNMWEGPSSGKLCSFSLPNWLAFCRCMYVFRCVTPFFFHSIPFPRSDTGHVRIPPKFSFFLLLTRRSTTYITDCISFFSSGSGFWSSRALRQIPLPSRKCVWPPPFLRPGNVLYRC